MPWWKRVPFFYGWIIVAVTFICFAVGHTAQLSFSVFYVAILEEFGWSRAALAGAYSAYVLVYGLVSAVAGVVVDRYGPRIALPVGGIIMAAGLALLPGISALWQFYLLYGVVASSGISLFGSVPSYSVINNWFVKKRGTAMGFATSGIGVGMMLLVPLLQSIISTYGWRTAYLVLAAIILVVVPSTTYIFQRHRPQDLGLRPDGEKPSGGPEMARRERIRADVLVVDKEWVSRDWTLAAAARTARFWLILVARALELGAVQVFLVHQAAYLVDAGYDKMLVATVVGGVTFVGSGAKIMWGVVSDRLGREQSLTLAFAAGTVGVAIALSIHPGSPLWMPYLYAVVYGLCYGVSSVLMPSLAGDIFHGRWFGSILGGLYAGGGIGSAAGAFLAGYVFDVTHSYVWAFLLVVPVMWLSCLLYWMAAPRKVRLVAGKAKRAAVMQTER